MGKRGPHPTPAALKLARGTLRKDRDGDPALQPQAPPAVLDEPPEELGEHGRTVWVEKGPQLVAAGTLTALDVGPFTRYCIAHDQAAEEMATIEEDGKDYTTPKGFICQHPAVNRLFKWIAEMKGFEARFGMTASDRCGIQLPGKGQTKVGTRTRA